ncbi:uncharacterized protein LOC127907974 isoform X2 [Oncorhynchus keta]|uniref:uncharacterized protein LOC127907974 isoform X2 n=1 Tax=Oncorhynchus keta TaxID=8018 RepID=UPI00227D2C94|nr:uncharacterized protein LOC127907974 isoform X2 [Oncorhynchus keta]
MGSEQPWTAGPGQGSPSAAHTCPCALLIGVPVTQVAAGGTHTLALTLPGLVYCCGANRAGQLGLNRVDENGRFNICSVPALRVLGVSFISCGEAHSAVLTKVSYYYCGEGHCCSHQGIILLLWRGTLLFSPRYHTITVERDTAVLTKVSYYYCGEGHCCSHQGIILLLWRGTLLFSPRYHTITVERDTVVLTKVSYYYCGEGHCCSHQGIILLLWRGTLLFSPRYHTIAVERDTAVLTKVSYYFCGEAHSAVLTKVSCYYCGEGHCCSHQGIILLLWRGTLLFSPRYHTITVFLLKAPREMLV